MDGFSDEEKHHSVLFGEEKNLFEENLTQPRKSYDRKVFFPTSKAFQRGLGFNALSKAFFQN